MSSHAYEIGLCKHELDTPALLVDMDVVERNVNIMADFCRQSGVAIRPHAKIYKATPTFAWMQLRAGAVGLTVAKVSEAEVLAAAGIKSILIANQVVGALKIRRLVNLAAYTELIVAVDSLENIAQLSAAASQRGVELGVLVEIDIGNNRCGVLPFGPAREAAAAVERAPGLKFRGVMGYDGHLAFLEDKDEQRRRSIEAYTLLVGVRDDLICAGFPVEIVSGGGSATYRYAASVQGVTELQAGSYILNDTAYAQSSLPEFGCALTVLATVVSRPDRPDAADVAVLDTGRKSLSLTYGFPQVKSIDGEVYSMPQEHARLRLAPGAPPLRAGDQVELWVRDANETVNLYDCMYAMRGDTVEAVWDIYGRGRSS